MIDWTEMEARATRLEQLLADKFGARKGSLERRLRKAGRRLPRATRRDVAQVAEARQLTRHPKLMRMVDARRTERAFRLAEQALTEVDVADRRKGALLGMLGALVFNLMLVVALWVAVVQGRGLLD